MLMTCKCLNVAINTEGCEIQDVNVADLNLTAEEECDDFFQSNIGTVVLGKILKEQGSFVKIRNIGNWIIHHCLNCSTTTHAIHREKGAAFVLVSKSLLTKAEDINELRKSDKYSTLFRIVIKDREDASSASPTSTKFSVSQMPPAIQAALSTLQQELVVSIQQETAHTEERVRTYSEQQFAALEEFRERAHKEHRILSRILCEAQEPSSPVDNLDALKSPPNRKGAQNIFSSAPFSIIVAGNPPNILQNAESRQQKSSGKEPSAFVDLRHAKRTNPLSPVHNPGRGLNKTEQMLPKRIIGHAAKRRNDSSLDGEGLFDLEGMEEVAGESCHSEEETDTDDSGSHDEGIHIPRARGLSTNIAKSLPVNVPAFLPRQDGEEREERLPQRPDDIAASIKALAKSVHGDSDVFGDLPRPRFSTDI